MLEEDNKGRKLGGSVGYAKQVVVKKKPVSRVIPRKWPRRAARAKTSAKTRPSLIGQNLEREAVGRYK